ncbi:piggyBac transposable element-derived protein 3-like [Neoarius graeffei]|uniref:piggyBac transposable element-derived protein 3-like n=1 Tax=Neoarius graeffei TaxID=443677 RepID=UPI00298D0651|nr:piggyBac transposable element-derived protein 3-like [Neoarius graeffei]
MSGTSKSHQMFSVQDIIDIIQNGDSDVELSSDSSDDEDCGSVREVEKENKIPNHHDTLDVSVPKEIVHPPAKAIPRNRYRWLKRDFVSPCTDFSGKDVTDGLPSICTPLKYFQNFVTEDMIQALTENTNQYSVQKKGTSINTNKKEIEQMIGMYLKMGLMQMAGISMYWETDTRYSPVADVMPRNRFQALLTSLHFVNNLTVSETEQRTDKLWKLRRWLDAFRERCLQVVPEEHNSVDEMMIPFRGKFSNIKQSMRGKPNPWGFKLWVRAGISGMLCDFDVYQGSVNGTQSRSELGLSGDVVMKLASTLPHGQNYKIYADYYFTSIPLVARLRECGIHYTGTARQVRLPNCNLNDEKTLKKKGRGTFDVRVEKNHNICAVTWYDTRQVTLVSSFTGPEPVEKVKRWDKTAKTFVEVQRPNIVATYNKNMGGVDLLDSFAAKYKFPLKSHHWYIYIFWHTIILAVINAWLLYKQDCKAWAIPKKEILIRRWFQAQLASSLILTGTSVPVPK